MRLSLVVAFAIGFNGFVVACGDSSDASDTAQGADTVATDASSDTGATDTGASDTGPGDTGTTDTVDATDAGTSDTVAGDADATAADADAADPGDTFMIVPCAGAVAVDVPSPFDAPVSVSGDTTGATDDYAFAAAACGYTDTTDDTTGWIDQVYEFTAPTDGRYPVSVTATGAVNAAVYALVDCADPAAEGACINKSLSLSSAHDGAERMWLDMAADQQVFVIVETQAAGAFTLAIDPPLDASAEGGSCAAPSVLAGTPPLERSTTLGGRAGTFNGSDCLTEGGTIGQAHGDQVFSFTAPTAGAYTITAASTEADNGDFYLMAFMDSACAACTAVGDSRDDADTETSFEASLTVTVTTAPAEVFFVVDGHSSGAPVTTLDITVSEAAAVADGDTCAMPAALTKDTASATPRWIGSGDLGGGHTDSLSATVCGHAATTGDTGANDQVWSFTVPAGGGDFSVTTTAAAGDDVVVYAFNDADCTTCGPVDAPWSANAAPGEDDVLMLRGLTAGAEVKLVVDAVAVWAAGAYTIAVDFIPPPSGNTCGEQRTLNGPVDVGGYSRWSGSGDTKAAGLTDDFDTSGCTTTGSYQTEGPGQDIVYGFTTTNPGNYSVTVDSAAGTDHLITIFTADACDAAEQTCLGYMDDVAAGAIETLIIEDAPAEATYWIVVDSYSLTQGDGPYTIEVAEVCTPVCTPGSCADGGCDAPCPCGPGETCGDGELCVATPGDGCGAPFVLEGPTVVGGVDTWTGSGDTSAPGVTNAHGTAGCEQLGTSASTGNGDDQVHAFTTTLAADYLVTLTSEANGDHVLMVFSADNCDASQETCLGYQDTVTGNGATETLLIENAPAGATYWIVVDGFDTLSEDTYTLLVEQGCIPTACAVGSCADNGCGERCPCASGEACGGGDICQTIPDTCATAGTLTLDADPVQGGDTSVPTTTSAFEAMTCTSQETGTIKVNVRDNVWTFTAPAAGDYLFTATPSGFADIMLYALPQADCATMTNCIAAVDLGKFALSPETLTLTLAMDESVTIVVDAWHPGAVGAYTLSATVAPPVCPELATTITTPPTNVAGDARDLVIEAVRFGATTDQATLRNLTDADIAVTATNQWCSAPPNYDAATAITVPANGRVTVDLPIPLNDTADELAFYRSTPFDTADNVVAFVAWGAEQVGGRSDEATASGAWSAATDFVATSAGDDGIWLVGPSSTSPAGYVGLPAACPMPGE